jgi:predicted O-methyltransferase YrrM
MIIELGTGLGISTLYLSAAATGIPLHTIEGNPVRAKYAGSMFMMNGMEHVQVHVGDLGRELDHLIHELRGTAGDGEEGRGRFLAFVDGNHRFEPTIRYMRQLVDAAGEEAVIVLDDICWSREMHAAWMEVTGWPETRATIDLFHAGIILLRRDLHKACIRVKF